jgi:large subunit ribosomal protein L25
MEVGKLTVDVRTTKGKGFARRLRAQGLVPGVCYGVGVEGALSLSVDPKALKGCLDPVKRQNTVIELDVRENGTSKHQLTAMVREYQLDPIRRVVTHVDLIAIDRDKKVVAEVPVEITGKAAGVVEGGQLRFPRHSIQVVCKPADIPARFVLDVTPLDIGDVLHASDLTLPEGVELEDDESLALVTCVAVVEDVVVEEVEEGAEGAAPAEGEGAEAKEEDKKDDK